MQATESTKGIEVCGRSTGIVVSGECDGDAGVDQLASWRKVVEGRGSNWRREARWRRCRTCQPGDVGVGDVIEVIDAVGMEFGEEFERGVGKLADMDARLKTVGDGGAQDPYGLLGCEGSVLAEDVDVFGELPLGAQPESSRSQTMRT